MRRVMWIEQKIGDGLSGPARIGWVSIKDKGKRLEYAGKIFRTLRGKGFKSNYVDIETGEKYWISGCHKDGRDALYGTNVEIDNDALDEYWINIRQHPGRRNITRLRSAGKY